MQTEYRVGAGDIALPSNCFVLAHIRRLVRLKSAPENLLEAQGHHCEQYSQVKLFGIQEVRYSRLLRSLRQERSYACRWGP